jgi:hypothetical protein
MSPALIRILELPHHRLADPVEHVFLVADVVIQRHRLDADLTSDPAHRNGLEPVRVHHAKGGGDDALAGQTFAFFRDSHGGSFSGGPFSKRSPMFGLTGLHRTHILRTP